jgi:HPt (histidine-containing phosphotransfer) domain-containing protein
MTRDVDLALVDLDKLRIRFDNDEELLAEIFRVFLAEEDERRAKILAAMADGDLNRLSGLAHSLKGVAGTIYAEELRQAAFAVEMAAKAGDAATALPLGQGMLDLLARTAEDLKRFF